MRNHDLAGGFPGGCERHETVALRPAFGKRAKCPPHAPPMPFQRLKPALKPPVVPAVPAVPGVPGCQ